MRRSALFTLTLALALALAAGPVRAQPVDGEAARWSAFMSPHDPAFARHPAGARYRGAPHALAFAGRNVRFRVYRTRIASDSQEQGADFAGDRSIVVIGCGSDCRSGYNVGLRDGTIQELPPGRYTDDFDVMQRVDSLYLKILHRHESTCLGQAYLWTGRRLRLVGPQLSRRTDAVICPRFDHRGA